jgi:signal peptidase I
MMSDEHGRPDQATGAQGAGETADGASRMGRHGYSALAGGGADANRDAYPGADGGSRDPSGLGGRSAAGPEAGYQAWAADDTWIQSADEIWSQSPDEPETGPDEAGNSAAGGKPAAGGKSAAGGGPADGGKPAEGGKPTAGGKHAKGGMGAAGEPGPDEAAPKRRMSTWRELPILIVVALTIALVIKTFVVQPFFIPSSSMEDTLLIGDKVLVNKLVYHFRSIEPGDIIVFNGDGSWNPSPPASPPPSNFVVRAYDDTLGRLFHSVAGLFGTPVGQTDYIKRVIGTPGDRVMCCNAQGLVTVNGVPLHEQSYLYPGAAPSQIKFNIVVPPGRLWVMGDNRAVSDDSRLRMSDPGDGTIPENMVIGRAFVIVWPPSRWRILPIPSTFDQPGINGTGSAAARTAGPAAASTVAASTGADQLLGAKVAPQASYLPLAAGFLGAVPLTWLQRRARRRLRDRLRHWHRHRHS